MFNRDVCLSEYRMYCQYYTNQRGYIADMAMVAPDNLKLVSLLHDRLLTFKQWFESYYNYSKFPSEWNDIADIKFGPINI